MSAQTKATVNTHDGSCLMQTAL